MKPLVQPVPNNTRACESPSSMTSSVWQKELREGFDSQPPRACGSSPSTFLLGASHERNVTWNQSARCPGGTR